MEIKQTGVIEDPRSDFEKSRDYKTSDLAQGEIVLNWKEYNDIDFKPFEIQNQDGSLSCVSQATVKILGMHEVKEGRSYKRLCPKLIYDWRQNYPDGGMWLPNALAIACNTGTCEEHLLPCDNQGETFMNDKSVISNVMLEDAQNYRGKFYFQIVGGIDEIAKVIEQGYGVLLGVRFDYDEWVDVPFINPNSKLTVGHGIAGTHYCLYKGEKAIMIEDSWGPHYGKGGVRILTETFLSQRCFYAGYVTSLPNYIFNKTLRLGSKGLDVKILQKKLGITSDGIFGSITKQAVIRFQLSHHLVGDGVVGSKTNAVLNSL